MIALRNVSITAGSFGLNDISFRVESGEYAVLMGKSGRGKTTLLEAICGLRVVQSGAVLIRERDVTGLRPGDRQIGYVPQDLALFPTMTVRQHLEFSLHLQRWKPVAVRQRVGELSDMLGIATLLSRGVHGLSGGESQRVALGRALASHPAVLLLDEPLSALDDETRSEMHQVLMRIQAATAVTVLHVTHNQEDARALASRVFLLDSGRISETAPPSG